MGRKSKKRKSQKNTTSRESGAWTMLLRASVVTAIVLFVVSRFFIFFDLRPLNWILNYPQPQIKTPLISDMTMYFEYAALAVDLHQTPYQNFEVPYPPLALWVTLIPRLIDSRSIIHPQDPSEVVPILKSYVLTFRCMMFLCDLIAFVMLLLITRKRCPKLVGWAAIIYAITTFFLGHVLYDRLDIGLLMLLMLGTYCWTRSLEESNRTIAWATAAYALIGISISFKIIPIIIVPFLILSDFHTPRRLARLTYAMIVLAAGICIPFVIQYAATGPGVFAIFKFHAERVVHLESLYSTLMTIGSAFGYQVYVSHSHGAFELSGDLSNVMITLSKILLGGFLAGMGIWALYLSRIKWRGAYRIICYIIPAIVILTNVINQHYFIWASPLILLLVAEVYSEKSEILWMQLILYWIILILLIAVTAITNYVFAYHTSIVCSCILFVFWGLMGILEVSRWSRYSRKDAYRFSCYVIPGAVIFAIVLSPQYFVWAFPLLLLLAVEIFPNRRVSPWILGALLIAVAGMTTWIFPLNFISNPLNPHALVPLNYNQNAPPSTTPAVVLGLRNFTYLGIILWMGVMLFIETKKNETPKPADKKPVLPNKSQK